MIHQQCPHCGHDLTLDEQRYNAGDIVIRRCPQCGSDMEFTITDTLWKEELRRQEQELEALLEKKQQASNPNIKEPKRGKKTYSDG